MKLAARPWRPLAALTVAVLALHGLALMEMPRAWSPARPAQALTLQVRTVQPEALVLPSPAPLVPTPFPRATRAAAAPTPPVAFDASTTRAVSRAAAPEAPPSPPPAEPQASPQGPTVPAAAFAVAGPARLRYEVQAQSRGLTLPGQAELLWRHDGSSYEARLEIGSALLPPRLQRSTGRIGAEGLAPARFSDRARSEEAAHFDRDAQQVVFSTNRPAAALLPGAQDRLSVLLQLGALIAAAPGRFPAGAALSVQTAGTREADLWLFIVEGEEDLVLPGGTVRGLKLTRSPRKEFDQKVELWLGPGMDYAPARLRLTQPNGDWLDLQWSATDRG